MDFASIIQSDTSDCLMFIVSLPGHPGGGNRQEEP